MFKGESFPSLTAWDHHEFPWYPADRRIVRRDTWSSHTWPEKSHWRKSRQRLHLGSSNTLESRNHSQINTNDTKKLGASPTVQHHILPGPTSTSSNHATTWARFRLNFQVAVPRHWQGLAPNKVLTNSLGNLPWYGGRQAPNVQKLKRLQKEWKCLIGIDTCSVLGPFISVASGAFDFISSDLDPYVWNSTALVNGPKSELQKVLPSFLCVRQKFQLQIHALRSWPSLASNSALREFVLSMFKS